MGPFGLLSTIDRAQTFLINQNHLSKDNYSYINPAFRGRQVFQQTNKTQLHEVSIFSFISKNGPSRTVIPYFPGLRFCYQQKSFI